MRAGVGGAAHSTVPDRKQDVLLRSCAGRSWIRSACAPALVLSVVVLRIVVVRRIRAGIHYFGRGMADGNWVVADCSLPPARQILGASGVDRRSRHCPLTRASTGHSDSG